MNLTIKEIYDILRGDTPLDARLYEPAQPAAVPRVADLLIDSRSLTDPADSLFFAISTARNDGHRYIRPLYDRGVRCFVVEAGFSPRERLAMPEGWFIEVTSTANALRCIGSEMRRRFTGKVVAFTGSRGKTMVKEWMYQMLSPTMKTSRSPRSYNSSLGVPLSLWQIEPQADIALIEAGISCPGEMEVLERMISPDIVVLTDIGTPHRENFPTPQAQIAEKLQLASRASVLIYPFDNQETHSEVQRALAHGVLPAGIRLVNSSDAHSKEGIIAPRLTEDAAHPWCARNLDSCVALMDALGIGRDEIQRRAAELHNMRTRLNVVEGVNRSLLVVDDYTADLHSLLPALDFMKRRATPDRYALTVTLTDLQHETLPPEETYRLLARACELKGVGRLIGIGREIGRYGSLFPFRAEFYSSADDALKMLSPSDFSNELILVKGTPDSGLTPLVKMLEARTHQTVLEVNLDALVDNFNFYRSRLRPDTKMVAMVKASGYGAGSYELSKTLQGCGAAYLAVAVLDEGIELRRGGITMPIMVLNPKVLNYPLLFSNELEPEVFSFEILDEIVAQARRLGVKDYPVHIKLDTGMHRLGFIEEEIPRLIEKLKAQDSVRVASVFSHLATADCFDMDEYTLAQCRLFDRCSGMILKAFPGEKILRHLLNTAGIIRFPEYQYDMVRLGIGLYGVPVLNDGSEAQLRQVSTLRTPVIALRRHKAGTAIGYGRRGVLDRDSLIATIPVGYADGIDRHLGCGAANFYVNGHPCPTVGNICMDLCMIDVTDVAGGVALGDSVEIFGENHPVGALSDPLATIPYEILTSISPRVPRIYYSE